MSFLSAEWLAWMWVTVSLYWLIAPDWRQVFLMAITLLFLGYYSVESAFILVLFTALTHVTSNTRDPKFLPTTSAALLMVAVLVYYKLNQTYEPENVVESIVIPLGISYYTFRCIHFLIERYKASFAATSLRQLAGYLFFLPTIVVGPINRYGDHRRDVARQRLDGTMLSEGAERILYGYAKIVILSNFLINGVLGDFIAGLEDQESTTAVYLEVVRNGLNLYFQFSGYSDIAIGFARLLGYRVMENFNWPYLQPNLAAFWRSWHISLSRWCRDYIYSVVTARTRSPALGALATMIAIGLWHEISFRFLFWGAYHGLGLIALQKSRGLLARIDASVPEPYYPVLHVLKVAFTVHFVWFGFVILTAPTPAAALQTFQLLLGFR